MTKPSIKLVACGPNWDNFRIREIYKDMVIEKIQKIPLSTSENVSNATEYVAHTLSEVNICLKEAAEKVSHGPNTKQYKPKHF